MHLYLEKSRRPKSGPFFKSYVPPGFQVFVLNKFQTNGYHLRLEEISCKPEIRSYILPEWTLDNGLSFFYRINGLVNYILFIHLSCVMCGNMC